MTGATTGLMNIETRAWHEEWMEVLGLSTGKLPELCHPDQVVGSVNASAAKLTGFVEGTPVLCGSGDAGATTMGAGAIQEGDAYIYMGTTGWIALPSFKVSKQHYGVFHLAHLPRDRYITIAPLLNVGNVHSWGAETFTDRQADNQFAAFESLAQAGVPG
ncbi:carbohydrate kinase, partial [Proteus mirabilis]